MGLGIVELTLCIVVGMLLAIIFSLRILVIMERRVARMELHIERIASRILKEERVIESNVKTKRRKK